VKRTFWFSVALGIFLTLLTGEVFFSVLENGREAETRALNRIPEGESWFFTGSVFTPPAERAAYRGPVGNPRDFLQEDNELGYRLRPYLRALPGLMKRGGEAVYEVTYSTNQFGWRVNPITAGAAGVTLFFGDSYVFGHGLKDGESLPARFSQYSGKAALNFGVPGWGAQQALRLLELDQERPALQGDKITGAYFLLIKEHLPRVAGLRLESGGTPRYKFGEGPPKFDGHFSRSGGVGQACSWSALCEAARGYFRIASMESYSLPANTSRELASVLSRIEDLLQNRHFHGKLKVLSWNVGDPVMDQLEGDLKERGLEVIPVRSLLPGFPGPEYAYPGDGHPTAKAMDELAKALAAK